MSTTGGRLKHVGAGEVWSVSDASELYEVSRWGKGYFSVSSAGHVMVHPTKDPSAAIDLKQLCDDLQARGINLPLLIRFSDILRHRLSDIHDAFKAAIAQHQYGGVKGNRATNRDPSPGRLSTQTLPPIRSQKRETMASPRPVPPYLRVVVT